MSPWTVLEFLPLLPIDPSHWPRWVPLTLIATAIEHAPTTPAWRDAMRARMAELHPGKPVRLTAFGRGAPSPEERQPNTPSARLDELFAEPSLRPALCQHPNATDDQLRRWARHDAALFRPLIANRWLPPDLVQFIFEASPDADEKRIALEHPRAPAAVLAHASELQRVGNPATPSATIEALLAKDSAPWPLSHRALSNHALSESVVAMLSERVGAPSVRNHPSAPASISPGAVNHLYEALALCPTTTRERFEQVLQRSPTRLNWTVVLERRDLPLDWKLSLLERLPATLASAALSTTLPQPLRARATRRIVEHGTLAARLNVVRAGGYDEPTWTLLAEAGQALLERMLVHSEPLARSVALDVLEHQRPELAPFIRLHPDREGATKGVIAGRWFSAGTLLPARGHLLAPPSTKAVKTVSVEHTDLVLCAFGTDLKTQLALVCRVSGALDDDAALREWLSGLRWSDDKEIVWPEPDAPSASKAKSKAKKKPRALADGPLTAKDLEAFLLGAKAKKGEATELVAMIRAFITEEQPKRRRVLVDDADSNQELGVWLLGSSKERLVVVRRWKM